MKPPHFWDNMAEKNSTIGCNPLRAMRSMFFCPNSRTSQYHDKTMTQLEEFSQNGRDFLFYGTT
jgi:hypothetical protein